MNNYYCCRAYGNTVAPNLLTSISGPRWAKTVAYVAVFIQTIVSFQIYASPVFEAFDTWYGEAQVWSNRNIVFRFVYRWEALPTYYTARSVKWSSKLTNLSGIITDTNTLLCICRSIFVVMLAFIAALLPFFGDFVVSLMQQEANFSAEECSSYVLWRSPCWLISRNSFNL